MQQSESQSESMEELRQKSFNLLQGDAERIEKLIEIQMENLTTRKCPLYEEVLDTQMYGLSKGVDFAVRVGLVSEEEGKAIISRLERNLAVLYEAQSVKE